MRENRDLYFLRKIAEKTCSCTLIVEIGEQKFGVSSVLNGMEFVHVTSQESIGTNSMALLASFLIDHSAYLLPMTDEQLYFVVVAKIMETAMSEPMGVTRPDMETLIGSLAEYQPDDVERYLKILKGI